MLENGSPNGPHRGTWFEIYNTTAPRPDAWPTEERAANTCANLDIVCRPHLDQLDQVYGRRHAWGFVGFTDREHYYALGRLEAGLFHAMPGAEIAIGYLDAIEACIRAHAAASSWPLPTFQHGPAPVLPEPHRSAQLSRLRLTWG